MTKILALFALLIGVSACHAGFGVGDNGQHRTYAAADPLESAVAQASLGTLPATGE
jgi:hypothetical protein